MATIIDYFGDSTIWGWKSGQDWVQVATTAPQAMQAALPQDQVYTVNNKGMNGEAAFEVLAGTLRPSFVTLLDQSAANFIIMNWGLNDIREGRSIVQYKDDLRALIRTVRNHAKLPILETPNTGYGFSNIGDFAQAMREVATEQNVPLIDQYQMLVDYAAANGLQQGDITPDGTHPADNIYVVKGKYAAQRFVEITSSPTNQPTPGSIMALVIKDRVCETSTSTGTGPFIVEGPMPGMRTFGSQCSVGDTFYCSMEAIDANLQPTGQWQCGYATYSNPNEITFTSVTASSNADQKVNFIAGTKRIFIDLTAYQLQLIAVNNGTTPEPNPRNPLQQPFASDSIWNMPIGDGAVYVAAGLHNNWPNPPYGTDGDYATLPAPEKEIIVLDTSAPLRNIEYSSAGWTPGSDRCVPTGPVLFAAPVPDSFTIPDTFENHAGALLAQDGRTIQQAVALSRCAAAGPVTAFESFPAVDLYGAGISGSHGGSGLSALGGTLRLGEMRPGDIGVRHALKILVYARQELFKALTFADAYRWPADRADSYAVGVYGTDGNNANTAMKMGALLALLPTATIAGLGIVTEPGRQLFWTLQNYGAYIVDDSSSPGIRIATELSPLGDFTAQFLADYGFSFEARAIEVSNWKEDVKKLLAAMQVVNNNSPTSIGGGGIPRQPLLPSIAPSASPTPSPSPSPSPSPTPSTNPLPRAIAAIGSNKIGALDFRDEFDGSALDPVWTDSIWWKSPDPTINYQVSGGSLHIWPKTNAQGRFEDRNIVTDGKYYMGLGYIEFRAKMPVGFGCWPALWTHNHDDATLRPEIDVMECYSGGENAGNPGWSDTNNHPLAYAGNVWQQDGVNLGERGSNSVFAFGSTDLSAAYHDYGALVEADGVTFFFDDKRMGTKVPTTLFASWRMYLLISLQFGSASGNPNAPGAQTPPQGISNSLSVDHVRVWKLAP